MCRVFARHRLAVGAGLIALLCLLSISLRLRKINKTLEKIANKLGPQPPAGPA